MKSENTRCGLPYVLRCVAVSLVLLGLPFCTFCEPAKDALSEQETDEGLSAALTAIGPSLGRWAWGYEHVNRPLDVLRAARSRLAADYAAAGRSVRAEALALLADADVVLVSDIHDLEICRVGFEQAVRLIASLRVDVTVAIGFEALPRSWQSLVDGVRRGDEAIAGLRMLGLLKYCWPWPTPALARIAEAPPHGASRLLALGTDPLPTVLPASGVPDKWRVPQSETRRDSGRSALRFEAANVACTSAVEEWIGPDRPQGRRVVVALYGLAHVCDPQRGIPALLVAKGFKVVTVIPFVQEIAGIQLSKVGSLDPAAWFRLAPGVFYANLVPTVDILAEGAKWRAARAAARKSSD